MSFTTYYIPDTFAEKQDMDPILKQQLLAFILGGSFLSTITGFVTLKYTKKQAEAKALSSVQDVYQELIADLRADKLAMKKDKEESEPRWTTRIEKLENNQQSQDKKIADNEKEIADLKRFKCINLSCNNRKQSNTMHTFLFVLPALHALVLFMVAVLLIKTIVALKSKPVFLSQTQLYASELKMPAPDSTLIKKKRAKAGKSKLTSTHQSRQIRRPAYPRYRISRLKGT